MGCVPKGDAIAEANYYLFKATQFTYRYEQHPKSSTAKRALKYVDKAVEVQGGAYTWPLIDIKIAMLLGEKKAEEGIAFVQGLDEQEFKYAYQREMCVNLFKSIKIKEYGKDNSVCFIANRELINKYLNDNKKNIVNEIKIADNITYTRFYFIMQDLLVNELNLRNKEELMLYIDSMQHEYGGDSNFYSSLKKNLYISNHMTVRANKRLK